MHNTFKSSNTNRYNHAILTCHTICPLNMHTCHMFNLARMYNYCSTSMGPMPPPPGIVFETQKGDTSAESRTQTHTVTLPEELPKK